jgi:hypothetical protein
MRRKHLLEQPGRHRRDDLEITSDCPEHVVVDGTSCDAIGDDRGNIVVTVSVLLLIAVASRRWSGDATNYGKSHRESSPTM